jgi:hypothetical protein
MLRYELNVVKRLLVMDDYDKGYDMACYFPQLFIDWCKEKYNMPNQFNYLNQYYHINNEDDIEKLYLINKSIFKKYYDDDEIRHKLSDDWNAPIFLFLEFEKIVYNSWMIHFTDDAFTVAWKGFKKGVLDIEKLAYSKHLSEKRKPGGYNFAFDVNNYKVEHGREIVLFQATGVKVYHFGDMEKQIIFWGETAKNLVPIRKNTDIDVWSVGENKHGYGLYKNESLDEVINWTIRNFNSYRKKLIV